MQLAADTIELEIRKDVDLEHEKAKSVPVEPFHDLFEKREQKMQTFLKDLHAEQATILESVVDRAVHQAIARVPPASKAFSVLHSANEEAGSLYLAQHASNEQRTVSTKHTVDSLSDRDLNRRRMPRGGSLEQSIKDVRKTIIKDCSVLKLARADSMFHMVSLGGWRATLENVVSHPLFEHFVAIFILANAIFIAFQTEVASHDPKEETLSSLKKIDLFFTVFFAMELTARIIVEKQRFILGRNRGWNLFHTFVVLSAILEEILSGSTNMTAIRLLRIMRLVRVIRVIRTLRMFNDLRWSKEQLQSLAMVSVSNPAAQSSDEA